MKKLLSAVCILAMTAMTLAGCGSSSTQETKAATTEAAVSEAASEASEALDSEGAKADGSYTVGIIQLRMAHLTTCVKALLKNFRQKAIQKIN